MSTEKDPIAVDISAWVERSRHDPQRYLERQATEVLLAAIGQSAAYGDRLYLKGGTLMGVVYGSPRQTADLDFTAGFSPDNQIEEELRAALDTELRRAAARIGYPALECRVQSIKRQPRRDCFVEADFPALDMKIAYAERDTRPHKQLQVGQCPTVLKMEVSFKEPVHAVQLVRLGPEGSPGVRVYSLVDVMAEKLRALLQQTIRGRNRRQDIYDLDFLLRLFPPTYEVIREIHEAFLSKSRSRGIEPRPDSLADPEVKRHAEAEWHTLALELGELPPFPHAYANVEAFYRSLPW